MLRFAFSQSAAREHPDQAGVGSARICGQTAVCALVPVYSHGVPKPEPGDLLDRRSKLKMWILVLVGSAAFALAVVGAGWAADANSQTNRLSDSFADIGVAYGVFVATGAGAVALGCWIKAIVIHHRHPRWPRQDREWFEQGH
jgi:hypothetical protein